MKTPMLALLTFAAFAPALFADPAHAPKAPAKTAALICPISGEKISSVSAAAGHETYKGKTYYFCCSACKPMFDKNPDKAVASAAKGKFGGM